MAINVRLEKRHKTSWIIVVDKGIDPVTKKRIKERHSIKTDDPEVAEAERLKTELAILKGTYKHTDKTTLAAYIDRWFETSAAKGLASKTIERYKQCADLRIKPWIGNIRLRDLKRTDLQSFYDRIIEVGHLDNLKPVKDGEEQKKEKRSIGNDTVAHHHRFIRRVLNHAVYEDEILERNVAARIKLPAVKAAFDPDDDAVKVFTSSEIATLEEEAKSTPYAQLIAVALRTGMRREELLGLRWDAVNFKDKTILIKQALVRTKASGYEIKPTKNKKRRLIEATNEILNAFKAMARKQAPHKLRLGENYRRDLNLIFCREDGFYSHPDTISSWFPDFCKSIGVTRLSFHCLRHTHASHLLAAGEDLGFVSKRLGHSGVQITYQTYTHFIPMEKREALQELEKRFKKK